MFEESVGNAIKYFKSNSYKYVKVFSGRLGKFYENLDPNKPTFFTQCDFSGGYIKCFVFDVDRTLIDGHTNGIYSIHKRNEKSINDFVYDKERINKLGNTLFKLKKVGYGLFINSRGNYIDIVELLKDLTFQKDGMIFNFKQLFHDEHIFCANMPQILGDLYNMKNVEQYKISNTNWPQIKSFYLDKILYYYAKNKKDDILFYDDTSENIVEAKKHGFMKSYIVRGASNSTTNNLLDLI